MLELLDIRFSFLCRTDHKNKDGKNPIILRISFRNSRRDLFTGLYCFSKDWSKAECKVLSSEKESATINKNLEIILRKANNQFDKFRFSEEDFTIDELVSKLRGDEENPELLIDYLEKGNEAMLKRVGVEITQGTYYKYRRSLRYMQEFLLKHQRVKNYTLKRITVKFLQDYFHFLRTDKNISHNRTAKTMCHKMTFVVIITKLFERS